MANSLYITGCSEKWGVEKNKDFFIYIHLEAEHDERECCEQPVCDGAVSIWNSRRATLFCQPRNCSFVDFMNLLL